MKKIVLTFGLISGAILSAMLILALPFQDAIGFENGMILGYTSMVLAFLLIYFGVRSYRDNLAGGTVRFGRAFVVGSLIALVASLCYVVTWEVIYFNVGDEFTAKYQAHMIEKARAKGESDEAIAAKRAEMEKFAEMYNNLAFNAAITFLEPLPVGLLFTLVSAAILSRRKKNPPGEGGALVPA